MSRHVSAIPVAFVTSWTTLALSLPADAAPAADSTEVGPRSAAAAPDSARLAVLRADLGTAHWIRVHGVGWTIELKHPQIGADGIGFAGVKGLHTTQPALITDSSWHPDTPPPNPLGWPAIERIEVTENQWGPGTAIGGGLGLWGGLALAATAGWVVGYATNSVAAGAVTAVGVTIAGAALGAYAMGHTTEWVEVYPRRVHQPDSTASLTRASAR
jgi:hypothetical protein